MTTPVRTALVGAGRMGAFHAQVITADVPEVELVAVVDPAPAAAELADSLAVPHTTLEAAGAEAWLIAAPTVLHPDLVRRGLAAGVAMLCEKPLSLDAATGWELASEAQGAVLQVGLWRRYSPPWVEAKTLLTEGAIGRPVMLRLNQWDADPPPPAFCDPSVSGGLAVDCGIHEFDLIAWLTEDPPRRVLARAGPIVDEGVGSVGDVDNLVALVETESGIVATVDLSRNCRYGDDVRTEILGDDGALFIDTIPAGALAMATARGRQVVERASVTDAMAAGVAGQARAFAAAVRGEGPAVPGPREATAALEVALAARRSAATGAWVDVNRR